MKKFYLLCLICLICTLASFAARESESATAAYFSALSPSGVKFFERMRSCSPAKYEENLEFVYGKTKNGKCHYSYKQLIGDEYTVYHCMLPMRVALAYATTALDAKDFSEEHPELADERAKQNAEIKKVLQDYCIAK